jgi:hypothetical protein
MISPSAHFVTVWYGSRVPRVPVHIKYILPRPSHANRRYDKYCRVVYPDPVGSDTFGLLQDPDTDQEKIFPVPASTRSEMNLKKTL